MPIATAILELFLWCPAEQLQQRAAYLERNGALWGAAARSACDREKADSDVPGKQLMIAVHRALTLSADTVFVGGAGHVIAASLER